jgi:beta-lactamase superfamily II metal-dependent hydrolase
MLPEHRPRARRDLLTTVLLNAFLVALLTVAGPAQPASAAPLSCTTPNPGEVTVYWFDVEQGDGQLVIGPGGKTLLIDLGETAWNSKGVNTKATLIEAKIRSICGTGANPVALDYVMASHHHLDHIGYAWNPQDTPGYVGNGIYQLLTPTSLGGYGFTVGTLLDRDGGTWTDANGDGDCTVGTSDNPSNEIAWHNAGTTSQTARRWICWLYGPAGQADRSIIQGHVTTLANTGSWPAMDLGTGVAATILNANAKDTMMVDGVTPVSGDHTGDATPPSENDYSIAVKVTYGLWEYATAGDSDGEYATSGFGYTYNDIEAKIGPLYGNVETYRLNHHGSGHSSNDTFLGTLRPETVFISCGANSYGHPSNRATDTLRSLVNEKGTGTDMYIANNPCDTKQPDNSNTNYQGILNTNGDVRLVTTGGGTGYVIYYDVGNRTYSAYDEAAPPPPPDPSIVRVNEFLMAPKRQNQPEWIELYNPGTQAIDLSGLYIDDVASGGGAPKQIPAGTTIAAGGRWVFEFTQGYLNNTGPESVRFLKIVGGVETVYDTYSYNLGTSQIDKVFHRIGDGGTWCNTISSNVTKGTTNPTTCP